MAPSLLTLSKGQTCDTPNPGVTFVQIFYLFIYLFIIIIIIIIIFNFLIFFYTSKNQHKSALLLQGLQELGKLAKIYLIIQN